MEITEIFPAIKGSIKFLTTFKTDVNELKLVVGICFANIAGA